MKRLLPWITALVLLAAAGLAHGLYTERWRPSDALAAAAARLDRVPRTVGDWQGTDVAVEAEAFVQAGARNYWARSYRRRGGGAVLVVLMCGRAGRMAVHTPEVCYRGAGYDLLESPARATIRGEADDDYGTFWSARFSKQTGGTSDLRLYWAWGDGADWQAPTSPRWQFRGRPFLYKLYASHELTGDAGAAGAAGAAGQAGAAGTDATMDLLRQLLPTLREALAAPDTP